MFRALLSIVFAAVGYAGNPFASGPRITTEMLPGATVSSAYNYTLSATGGKTPYRWSASALPSGISITSGGSLIGTPVLDGTFTVYVQVMDRNSRKNTKALSLVVSPVAPPPPPPPPPPSAKINSFTVLPASINPGETATLSWAVENAVTVSVAGIGTVQPVGSVPVTPETSQTYTISATGADNTTVGAITKLAVALTVVSPSALPSGTVGTPYNYKIEIKGGTPPYTCAPEPDNNLVDFGLTLSTDCVVSGTPTKEGQVHF